MRSRSRIAAIMLGAAAVLLSTSAPAHADATVFLGSTTTPAGRLARGFAVGASLVIVGFEFEYSSTIADFTVAAPSLQTGMGNAYAQTPLGAIQFYALVGAGMYRERFEEERETSTATAVGGGAKLGLTGPLRLRIDYRVFNLRGSPRHSRVHRVYTGLNFLF